MANHKSALKRHRQSLKRRARNRISKTRIKNTVKAVRVAIEEKDVAKAMEALKDATSILDRAARKRSSTSVRLSAVLLAFRWQSTRSLNSRIFAAMKVARCTYVQRAFCGWSFESAFYRP